MFPAKINKALSLTSTAFVLAFYALVTPSAVLAQAGGAPEGDPVAIYKQAGINTEQEANIRKIAEEYEQASTARLQSLSTLLHDLRNMAYQPKLNETAMLAKQTEVNQVQSEMALQRIKLLIKIRGTLTPAQNQKLASILQDRARAEAAGMQ